MSLDREAVKQFEIELDSAIDTLAIYQYDANTCLKLGANMLETAALHRAKPLFSALSDGFDILAPRFTNGRTGPEPDAKELVDAHLFASSYYLLREYLYYTYNARDSFLWNFVENEITIRFLDRTIPRQFFIALNNFVLDSMEAFRDESSSARIRDLLSGEAEGVLTEKVKASLPLLEREADTKLSAYFSILDPQSRIDVGGYTYAEFYQIFRVLLIKTLFHRHFAQANDVPGAIFAERGQLIRDLAADTSLSEAVCDRILAEITYSIEALYFALYEYQEGGRPHLIICPHHFSMHEGLISFLRLVALRRPKIFLDHLSDPIAHAFVKRCKTAFEEQGFACKMNVRLPLAHLPDIDLLVISEEPMLGYVVFVCEIKSPIPPGWSKDYLRALNKDNVSKAFRQVKAISDFLGTTPGVNFLRAQLPAENPQHFDGFVVAVFTLIITSSNAGMFFADTDQAIIDFRTLERILRRSDGDVHYIMHILRNFASEADKALKVTTVERQVGKFLVRYEGVTTGPVLDFPQNKWRSSGMPSDMLKDMIEAGGHPFDIFEKEDDGEAGQSDSKPPM